MTNKILYVQNDYNMAAEMKECFNDSDIMLDTKKTGEEALETLKNEDNVLLLLADQNGLSADICDVFEHADNISAGIPLFAIINNENPLQAISLANKYNVKKIYLGGTETGVIASDLKEYINKLGNEAEADADENEVPDSDKNEIEKTVRNLAEILKKQQRGFSKLDSIFNIFSEVMDEDLKDFPDFAGKELFAKEAFMTMLKMQTTGSFDIESFADLVKEDLLDLRRKREGIVIGNIENCLFGGISRSVGENIRFAIWVIAKYYSKFYDEFVISVTSHFLTTTEVEFNVNVVLSDKYKIEDIEKNSDGRYSYREFVLNLIGRMSKEVRREGDEKNIDVFFTIPIDAE